MLRRRHRATKSTPHRSPVLVPPTTQSPQKQLTSASVGIEYVDIRFGHAPSGFTDRDG